MGRDYGEVNCALREVKPTKGKNRCSVYVREKKKMKSSKKNVEMNDVHSKSRLERIQNSIKYNACQIMK